MYFFLFDLDLTSYSTSCMVGCWVGESRALCKIISKPGT